MLEKVCNLWIEPAQYRAVLTSGAINSDGTAVLDSDCAIEAKQRFADLDIDLGRLLASRGTHVHMVRPGLISFPIKQFRWSGVSLEIVERSARELAELVGDAKTLLPKPPAGEPGPSSDEITSVLSTLPDNIVVIQHT